MSSNEGRPAGGESSQATTVTSTSASSADFFLHPLPILNISEHIVRNAAQKRGHTSASSSQDERVYGALLGTQIGRHVEIHNTFEVKVDAQGKLDHAFFRSRQTQFKQTFPTFDVLGWYSSGPRPTAHDLDVHRQFLEYNESPLFLQLSPNPSSLDRRGGELPLQLYESQMELPATASDQSTAGPTAAPGASKSTTGASLSFVSSKYRIETGEAERIAIDHTSKLSDSAVQVSAGGPIIRGQHSAIISSLESQQSAIRMLQSRVQFAHQYVASLTDRSKILSSSSASEDSEDKTMDAVTPSAEHPAGPGRNHEVLRRLKSILATPPDQSRAGQRGVQIAKSAAGFLDEEENDFNRHFLREYNDALLTASLSRMTQNLQRLNELVDKFDLIQSGFGAGPQTAAVHDRGGR